MPAPVSRVLFLGLDGGTMSVFGPWFERGLLPNLASLWRGSAFGTLRSSDPTVTPVAWTSFATGCTPPVHGVHEFNYVDPGDRTIRANHAGRVRVPTLWHALNAAGREVVSLNLPMTFPPPHVRGIVVSGADSPGLDWAFAHCPDFGEEVRAHVPDFTTKLVWKNRPRSLEELRFRTDRNCALFRAQADVAERADARSDWSAFLVHFQNLDSLQHRLWPYLDVDDTGIRERGWNEEVERCLTALDECVGRLLELASRRDAAVVAVSDHGFGPCRKLVNVNGLLRQAGLQRGLMYGTRFRYRARRVADRLHRWLSRGEPGGLERRLPRSLEGQVACDWSRTVAFAPFGQLCGCVFLTPAAKANEERAERLRREVIDVLRDARDPETGAALFRDAFDTADRYHLDPIAEGLPDVMGLSADGYQAQAKWGISLRTELAKADRNLPGTHWLDGIVAIHAPDVRAGGHLSANIEDVAPTVLAMLGLSVPENMEGRVIHEAFEDPLRVSYSARPLIEDDPRFDELLAAGFGVSEL
jgi:predicted AlkP superfamily phosphohydrolase/phosphomutase